MLLGAADIVVRLGLSSRRRIVERRGGFVLTFQCDRWAYEGDAETMLSPISCLCRFILYADSFCSFAYRHLKVVVVDMLFWGFFFFLLVRFLVGGSDKRMYSHMFLVSRKMVSSRGNFLPSLSSGLLSLGGEEQWHLFQ